MLSTGADGYDVLPAVHRYYMDATQAVLSDWSQRMDLFALHIVASLEAAKWSSRSVVRVSTQPGAVPTDMKLVELFETQHNGRSASNSKHSVRIAELEEEVRALHEELRNFSIVQGRQRDTIQKLRDELEAHRRVSAVENELRTNAEYLRNIVLQFATGSKPIRVRLVPVLTQLLHLTPAEAALIEKAA